jgi:hypothetical protein
VALDRCSNGFSILHGKVGQQPADVALETGHSSLSPSSFGPSPERR